MVFFVRNELCKLCRPGMRFAPLFLQSQTRIGRSTTFLLKKVFEILFCQELFFIGVESIASFKRRMIQRTANFAFHPNSCTVVIFIGKTVKISKNW